MKQVLSPHRFHVGPSLRPGRFRAVDTRWVPVMYVIGAVLMAAGVFLAVGGIVGYYSVEEDSAVDYLADYHLVLGALGGLGYLLGMGLGLWGWMRRRAAKDALPMNDPPSVIHARWAGRLLG